jgi:N-acyl-phosphatidylethanolamine-hydrolysing phospholipase D
MRRVGITVGLGIWLVSLTLWACAPRAPLPSPAPPPAHHTVGGFRNPHLPPDTKNHFAKFLRWYFGFGPPEAPAVPDEEVPPYRPETVAVDWNHLSSPKPEALQVTWIGHSTFLVQTDGLNILTDPVFSTYASPVPVKGAKRRAPPGLSLEQLPPVDMVIISHNHYDHLDEATILHLGNRPRYFVPLGLKDWFIRRGIDNVVELDWWQEAEFGPLRLHCVPAQHFSARGPYDRNRTLWCGWVLEAPRGRVYFAGDSGYSPDFREIGRRLGPMRLAFLPIGAYYPRWALRDMHMSPDEAVRVHQEVGSRQSVAMHWGTFRFGREPMAEPPLYLKKALTAAGISPDKFLLMKIGETRSFPWQE